MSAFSLGRPEPLHGKLQKELEETRLVLEASRAAWREEHDARIEAEEARDLVTQAAEEARIEALEIKKKYELKIEEAKKSARQALEAKRLYERAKVLSDESRRVMLDAARAAKAGRKHDHLRAEAQELMDQLRYTESAASKRIIASVDTLEAMPQ